jgi:hypothetical protein
MFRRQWWFFGKTISDEGFSIIFTEKNTLLYEIGGRTMTVRTDGNFPDIDVSHSSMRHWNNASSLIDGKTDERNVDNVTRALEWRGFKVRIVTSI